MSCETNSFALLYLAHLLGHILGAVGSPTGWLVDSVGPVHLGVPVVIVCMGVTSLLSYLDHCQNSLYRGIPKLEIPLGASWLQVYYAAGRFQDYCLSNPVF